ncbi:MAG TPA: MauE/DoxX family redox-associated membrane protein [Solirubrobacteraceae bacterium]|nr:MauE/DoxX family redox-associated membrane protein [Solirubrobacteraceae bacterium]
MTTLVSIWLALALGASAAAKAWRSPQAAPALATYGVRGAARQRAGLWLLVTVELAVAAALVAGFDWALGAAAGLFALFAATTATALLAGRGGRPCACFGGSSRLGWATPVRAAAPALLAGAAALGWFPQAPSGYDRWLTLGLSLSVVAIAALAVAVLALAREVGVLRLSAGDARGALEIESEGPELGEAQPWAQAIEAGPRTLLRLAVFTSDGCPLCGQVAPAVEHVAGDPLLAVRSFDEHRDAAVWAAAAVPGSPYAVALGLDGVALAKGTFNGLGQLESVLATARSRERGLSLAA